MRWTWGITILTLLNCGHDARISELDYNILTFVSMVDSAGERSWRGGVKMREDVFLQRYDADQRKALNITNKQKCNMATHAIDSWVRIFDDVYGDGTPLVVPRLRRAEEEECP